MSYVVFDIDGTIADNTHRQHHLMGETKDWKAYNSTMIEDGLHQDIVYLMTDLKKLGHLIVLCTGREKVYEETTVKWLAYNSLVSMIDNIYMRKKKDYRSDAIVKVELLNQIREDYGADPFLWFDDRNQVVDAIRAQGVRVLQVAPGDF